MNIDISVLANLLRALDFLLEQGFIHRLASVNAFVSCHHPQIRHSVPFLICDRCHSATELEDASIVAALDAAARGLGTPWQTTSLTLVQRCLPKGIAPKLGW